jgi:transcription elongation factor GreA
MPRYLTKESLEKLKKELNYLETGKRKEIAERLRHAVSFGDLSENAAYQEAKEAKAFLEGKILELKKIIGNAVVVEEQKLANQVQIGCKVLVDSQDGREEFEIVGPEETDPLQRKISYESPLGKALLNKSVGEVVEINTPEGKRKYKIIKISF